MKKQEEVNTRMFTSSCFYIQKACRDAFRRGEIAPKICQHALAKKWQKLMGFCHFWQRALFGCEKTNGFLNIEG